MTHDSMWDLLDRYFGGACAPDELTRLERWLADDPARAEQIDRARGVWEASLPVPDDTADGDRFDARAAWAAVQGRIAAAPSAVRTMRPTRPTRPTLRLLPAPQTRSARTMRGRLLAAIAAAALLAVTSGIVWHRVASRLRADATLAALDGPMRVYATVKGQRAEIGLPDGTRIVLNVDSRLRVPVGYGARSRDVILEGEAFFQVAHDDKLPFRVRAGRALAEDLGTAFLVRAYPEDSGATVVVAEGSVALRASTAQGDAGRGVPLHARQLGRLDRSSLVSVTSDVDVERYLAWRQAQLRFDHAPLARVVRELERWYDIDITLADTSLASVPVTGAYQNASLDGILGDIAQSLDVRYTRQGAHVVFLPNEGAR